MAKEGNIQTLIAATPKAEPSFPMDDSIGSLLRPT